MATSSHIPIPPEARHCESGHDPIRQMLISQLRHSPENDRLYRPVNPRDPDILALARSIREHGVKEPLVITRDGFILSGHRRHVAAKIAGLTYVPCRVEDICWETDPEQCLQLLREYNRQREKSLDERLREEVVSANPSEAYEALIEHRRCKAEVAVDKLEVTGVKTRAAISAAKQPFLDAIRKVIKERRKFWPLSDRQIHYALLNHPPLKHASKPDSTYANDLVSYKALVDLLTRARLNGSIPFEAIADPTRPVSVWNVHRSPQGFIRSELDGFLKGYWRDLQQSQPNHIEIVGEKNTIASIISPVASEFCIPLTIGRGYCSLPPRHAIAKRFKRSGKEKLILLLLSDFDPDGEEIASSFVRSMRDDFGISGVEAVKVALRAEQVQKFKLPPVMKAKASSVHHGKFTRKHGDDVFELEALEPATLQEVLREAIDGVIDVAAFNHELDTERKDAAFLDGVRQRVSVALRDIDLGEAGGHP